MLAARSMSRSCVLERPFATVNAIRTNLKGGDPQARSKSKTYGTAEARALIRTCFGLPHSFAEQRRHHREPLLADVNHRLVVLSALSIFVVLLNGDRLIVFGEGNGTGTR